MAATGVSAEQVLVNGSTGDPVLYVDWPDEDNALLFDAGDNSALPMEQLADLRAVFISHHHVDHFIGLDRIVRANIDSEKVLSIFGPPGTIQKVYDRIRSYEYQYFPFQQIVLDVVDIGPETLTRARLECSKRFPTPEPETSPRDGTVVFRAGTTVSKPLPWTTPFPAWPTRWSRGQGCISTAQLWRQALSSLAGGSGRSSSDCRMRPIRQLR